MLISVAYLGSSDFRDRLGNGAFHLQTAAGLLHFCSEVESLHDFESGRRCPKSTPRCYNNDNNNNQYSVLRSLTKLEWHVPRNIW